jgi:hypothetical protein
MDRSLHTDNFERLLREKTDEFRMYPEQKIWHSIYNNIYPGRRWPSPIVGLILMFTLPAIGFLNTKTFPSNKKEETTINKTNIHLAIVSVNNISATLDKNDINPVGQVGSKPSIINNKLVANTQKTVLRLRVDHLNMDRLSDTLIATRESISLPNNDFVLGSSEKENTIQPASNNNQIRSLENKQPVTQKWIDKLALQVYASPSIVYGTAANAPTVSQGNGQDAGGINLNPSVGLEAGTAMQYSLSNFIKVKAGLQFNYASYDIAAFDNDHSQPTVPASLSDAVSGNLYYLPPHTSDYTSANNPSVVLHNETYQFSLPVGLEMKLLKSNKLQWNAGATIQPTYIAGGNAYLLTADNHTNYIDESSLINRWNLNAGLETFITYKINGVTWQFGPQFRYQFASTYGKTYSVVDEKVAVFGVKIGVTKVLH